ncbi:hypothetical protein [Bacillus sp. V2I10]|uniref:hypothetical protein n=1 Tax=Bacillus sp. V2I10 TaxID=3042276 RepID=UPI00278890E9|nr:hypothetical protein [Bacillus sp. V2I10]MDQ0857748.1 hypothetical protein [Bacillus sp. V2I10]
MDYPIETADFLIRFELLKVLLKRCWRNIKRRFEIMGDAAGLHIIVQLPERLTT